MGVGVGVDVRWGVGMRCGLGVGYLNGLKVDDQLSVRVPALRDKTFKAKVTAINALGSYANWRATKATGDFDLRTFSIRLTPLERDPQLRPGMSALINLERD